MPITEIKKKVTWQFIWHEGDERNLKDYLFSDVTEIEGNLYFYSANNGFLEKIDKSGNVEIVYVPLDKITPVEIESYENRIYALDVSGNYIFIYNIDNGEFSTLYIGCNDRQCDNFLGFFVYDNKMVIVPRYRNYILELNPHDNSIIWYDWKISGREKIVGCCADGKYWIFGMSGNLISSFDLTDHIVDAYMLENNGKKYIRCRSEKEKIYLLERNGAISCWDIEEHRIKELFPGILGQEFDDLVEIPNGFVLLPYKQKEDVWIIDQRYNLVKKNGNIPVDMQHDAISEWSAFCGLTKNNDKVFYAMRSTSYMLVIDRCDGSIEWRKVYPVADYQVDVSKLCRGEIIYEEKGCGLTFLMDYVEKH